MEKKMNAMEEIQKRYAGCNLLMPASTEVQLNPFYKVTVMEVSADLSENSGDVFKVGSVKVKAVCSTSSRLFCLCPVQQKPHDFENYAYIFS